MTQNASMLVRLPESLRKQAQAVAKLRGENLSDVVRAALKEYVAEALEDARDNRELDVLEARIDAGIEPLRDHAEVWREIDRLEAEGALPA